MWAHPSLHFILVIIDMDSDWVKAATAPLAALEFPCFVMTFGLLCACASLSKGLM